MCQVVEHVETVLAIELLAACQALDFHRPLRTTEPLERLHELVRGCVSHYERDRFLKPDIDAALRLIQSGQVAGVLKPHFKQSL